MILPGDALPQDRPTEVDVAIVGAGAVGVALVTRLAGRVGRIALIEAGGPRYELDQQLNFFKAEEVADRRHPPTELNRRRMLGGTTSVWGGRCIPLDPDDFRRGPGRSGWPVAFDEVAAHFPDALTFLDAGAPDFTISAALQTPSGLLSHTTDSDVLLDRIERFSKPTDVWKKWGATLAKAEQVTVLHGAACTEILVSSDGNRVQGLRLVTPSKKSLKILAPIVVLACGGLETPRLLLASRSVRSCGLGNEHDLVGRFYMTHLVGNVGHFRLATPKVGREFDYAMTSDGVYVRRLMLLSPTVRRREGLLNIVFRPDIPPIGDPSHHDSILSAMYFAKRFIIAEYARRLVAEGDSCGAAAWCGHLANIALGMPRLAEFGVDWMRRRTFATRKLPSVFVVRPDGNYPLEFNAEQSPDSESRVLLGSDLCPNGIPRLAVRWRMTEGDLALICRAYRVLRTAFKSSGVGTIQLGPDLLEQIRTVVVAQAGHHIGTVRMGQDPRTGVVDRYGEVWETKGLFVAGAALFPTSGFANPTLSAVALAFYLAEHLLQRKMQRHAGSLTPWASKSVAPCPIATTETKLGATARRIVLSSSAACASSLAAQRRTDSEKEMSE